MTMNHLCAVCMAYPMALPAAAPSNSQIAVCNACGALVCFSHANLQLSSGSYYCAQCIANAVP